MTELITTWQRFAEVTIKTNDLDPMYAVIHGLNKTKSRDWMGRYIMYFLLFYDAGGAYRVAENVDDRDFWMSLKVLAMRKETKRGTERRHFRGKNALSALVNLELRPFNNPWDLLLHMYGAMFDPIAHKWVLPDQPIPTYTEFYKRMTTAYAGTQFGPYFIWKLYDIFNVCLEMPISMTMEEAMKYMPDEPRKAAEIIFPNKTFNVALATVDEYISQFDHPVRPGKCGLAEAETVLCMLKGAFLTKSHTVGDDIDEKLEQLRDYPELQKLLPGPVGSYKLGDLVL